MFDNASIGIPTGTGTAWSGSAPLITPEPWTKDALCAETVPDVFFPTKGDHETAKAAKSICGRCDVVEECLAFALRTGQTVGIWGGKSARQLGDIRAGRATGRGPGRPRSMRSCEVEGCGREHMARGMCGMHYGRWLREKAA